MKNHHNFISSHKGCCSNFFLPVRLDVRKRFNLCCRCGRRWRPFRHRGNKNRRFWRLQHCPDCTSLFLTSNSWWFFHQLNTPDPLIHTLKFVSTLTSNLLRYCIQIKTSFWALGNIGESNLFLQRPGIEHMDGMGLMQYCLSTFNLFKGCDKILKKFVLVLRYGNWFGATVHCAESNPTLLHTVKN